MYIKHRIMPLPRHFTMEKQKTSLGAPGAADFTIDASCVGNHVQEKTAVQVLEQKLGTLFGPKDEFANGEVVIKLTTDPNAPSDLPNPEQGYELVVDERTVAVKGFGAPGLLYGVRTLCSLLTVEQNECVLPHMKILDAPDMKTRGHFMESRYGSNTMTLDDWKSVVDRMAEVKMNQLVISVYGCWCVQYDGRVSEYMYVPIKKYPKLKKTVVTRYYSPERGGWVDEETLPPMFEKDFLGELIAYGQTVGVSVFPLFNSYGHNTLIPAQYPEVSALDENGEPTLTGFCTSNPKTYELLLGVYDEIIDRHLAPNGVDSFHVGLDEVWDGIALNASDIKRIRSPWCQCEKCAPQDRKGLFIRHAIRLISHLKSRGMKNIYMYHDMLVRGEQGDAARELTDALKKNDLTDVTVIDWWAYSDYADFLSFQSTRPELGLRRTVKPWNGYYHWNNLSHPLKNIFLLAKMGFDEKVEGMQSYSAWDESFDRNHAAQADFAWNFKGVGNLQGFMEHYAAWRFGDRQELSQEAFALFDEIMSDDKLKMDDIDIPSNYALMMYTLPYYFYSYVKKDEPYPRNFPGEAIGAVIKSRDVIEPKLHSIRAMAKSAQRLFETMTYDTQTSMDFAERFGYEAQHYAVLADDYLTILKMADLLEGDCPYKFERIMKAANEQKRQRLSLMARLERVKEPYLMSSHMRNQTIFMHFFADLEAYLKNTKPEEVCLDFRDLGNIQSEAFRRLR